MCCTSRCARRYTRASRACVCARAFGACGHVDRSSTWHVNRFDCAIRAFWQLVMRACVTRRCSVSAEVSSSRWQAQLADFRSRLLDSLAHVAVLAVATSWEAGFLHLHVPFALPRTKIGARNDFRGAQGQVCGNPARMEVSIASPAGCKRRQQQLPPCDNEAPTMPTTPLTIGFKRSTTIRSHLSWRLKFEIGRRADGVKSHHKSVRHAL